MEFDYIENPLFISTIKRTYQDKAETYLRIYRQFWKETVVFLNTETDIFRSGPERIKIGQQSVRMLFNLNRLLNFVETTRMTFKIASNKEKAEIESFLSLMTKSIEDKFRDQFASKKTKKEREELLNLILKSNEDFTEKKLQLEEFDYIIESLYSEKTKLESLKDSTQEFINILKRE